MSLGDFQWSTTPLSLQDVGPGSISACMSWHSLGLRLVFLAPSVQSGNVKSQWGRVRCWLKPRIWSFFSAVICIYIYIYIHMYICIYLCRLASICKFYFIYIYILLALIVTIDLFILIMCTYMPYHTTPCQTRTYHIIQLIDTYIDCHRSINTCSLTAHVASVLAASRSTKRVPGCSRLGSAQLYRGEKRMLRMLKISDFVWFSIGMQLYGCMHYIENNRLTIQQFEGARWLS